MVPDVLVNILAAVLAGMAIVVSRVVKARLDPDEEIPAHSWQVIATQFSGAAMLMLGMVYVVSFAVVSLGEAGEWYVGRLAVSLAESPNATEGQRSFVEGARWVIGEWGWAWSWPYVLSALTTLYIGAMVVGALWGILEETPTTLVLYSVGGVLAMVVAAGAGGVAGYFGHHGVNQFSAYVYETTRPDVRSGHLDFYPADSVIQLTWPVSQSVISTAWVLMVAAFAWVAWRAGRSGYRSQFGPRPEAAVPVSAPAPTEPRSRVATAERVSLRVTETVANALREARRLSGRGPVQTGMVLVCLSAADGLSDGWGRFWSVAGYPSEKALRAARDDRSEVDAPVEFETGEWIVPSRDLAEALNAARERGFEPVVPGALGLVLLGVRTGAVARTLARAGVNPVAARESMENDVLGVDFPDP
ncbi:hypothetical protein JOD54_004445 [Actinokineospora baliensis]|uniref:hypothetical protein n=1 Tax=Actinokineospora baliensis TaxID=547056 RepID=UPI00195A3F15|nr:hypothetical protein [Actinokineospora baliensis]MBM7774241.1 hypothetical protein [Actinokineospora baliensis]